MPAGFYINMVLRTINVTLLMSDGRGAFLFLRMEEGIMPETKVESIIFTAVTAWIMVYIMTLYNTVIAGEDFVNATFLVALRGMWLEFVLIFLCAYFISGPAARRLTFRIVKPEDRPIVIIVTMQIFTVVFQVALASILGVYHSYGLTEQLIPDYIMTYCRNFIMALPVQLFLAGPAARALFRGMFRRARSAVQCSPAASQTENDGDGK